MEKVLRFSVVMLIYKNEGATFLRDALRSAIDGQPLRQSEIAAFKIDANVDETVRRLSEAVREAMKEKNMGDALCRHFEKDFSPVAFAQRYESTYSSFGFRQNGLQTQ